MWKASFRTYRSKAVTFVFSMIAKQVPLRPIFSQKSLGVKFEWFLTVPYKKKNNLIREQPRDARISLRVNFRWKWTSTSWGPVLQPWIFFFFFKIGNSQEPLESHSEWLLTENGPQGNPFCNHGGYQYKCDGLTPVGSKRSLPPVLPTMVGSNEQVRVCSRVLL